MNLCGIGSAFRMFQGAVHLGARAVTKCKNGISCVASFAIEQTGRCFRSCSKKAKDEALSESPSLSMDQWDVECVASNFVFLDIRPERSLTDCATRTSAHYESLLDARWVRVPSRPQFDPSLYIFNCDSPNLSQIELRLQKANVQIHTFAGKSFIVVDNYFSEKELERLAALVGNKPRSNATHFSTVGTASSVESFSEEEIRSLFFYPSIELEQYYLLFSFLSQKLGLKIMTHPWNGEVNAVVSNYMTYVNKQAEKSRFHRDFNIKEGTGFELPDFYSPNERFFPDTFTHGKNGEKDHPWMVTALLYLADKNFDPATMGMGTVCVDEATGKPFTIQAKSGRFIIFEADILHAIEGSEFPEGSVKTWRFSLNTSLAFCPQPGHSPKQQTLAYFEGMAPTKVSGHETDSKRDE